MPKRLGSRGSLEFREALTDTVILNEISKEMRELIPCILGGKGCSQREQTWKSPHVKIVCNMLRK